MVFQQLIVKWNGLYQTYSMIDLPKVSKKSNGLASSYITTYIKMIGLHLIKKSKKTKCYYISKKICAENIKVEDLEANVQTYESNCIIELKLSSDIELNKRIIKKLIKYLKQDTQQEHYFFGHL